jgi:uncharacterized membrane protein
MTGQYITSQRFIELDILRGFAISAMVVFHLLWDLDYFGIVRLNKAMYNSNIIVQALFLILVGVTLAVKSNRFPKPTPDMYKQIIQHGLQIFSLGMIITAVTLIVMPDRPILFGILHCIGLSIVLCSLFLRFKIYNLLFAPLLICAGYLIGSYHIAYPTVFHLMVGIHQTNVWKYTIDYFPLLPWFGVTLLGIALGNILYKDNTRRFSIPDLSHYKPFTLVSWMGKHSLVIYLCHQPIIAGALTLFIIL